MRNLGLNVADELSIKIVGWLLSGSFLLLPRRFLAADMSLLSCGHAAFWLPTHRF